MRTAAICPTCATYENAICVLYDGPYLPCTGISPLDSIAEALAKIDAAICALGGTTTSSTTSTTTTAGPTTTTTTTIAGPTTTTTTTTVSSCTAPVITDISTNGAYPQSSVTIDYNLNGIIDVLSVTIAYSIDPDFSSGFNDTISNLVPTSYTIPGFSGTTTWYFRLRKVCGTDPEFPTGDSYSNVVSIVPQPTTTTTTTTVAPTTTTTTTATPTTTTTTTAGPTTTTTTTISCTVGLDQYLFMYQLQDSEFNPIYIVTTPIGEACDLLPAIHGGSGALLHNVYVESLTIGQTIIYSTCNPLDSGTYALYVNPLSGVTTFIAVVDGVITDIVDCSTTTTTTTATPTTTTTTTAL
jgi:hypothetical protein